MSAWVWITIAAALAQTLRFMLQKKLAGGQLSAAGATYARFLYSAPLVAVLALIYAHLSGQGLPLPGARFWAFALAGGLTQILATVLVVTLFSMRNFAVGITLKKTEVMQTAVIGFILLGELISLTGMIGIAIGFVGVLFLSDGTGRGLAALKGGLDRTAWIGLASGALFGVSGVAYRGASLSLESGDVALRAVVTLACVTLSQMLAMTLWLAIRDRAQIGKVVASWRSSGLVGITSMIGSICWFTAFTLQQAAYVNAVGQIELVFSVMASTLIFGETIRRREWIGMGLLAISILVIVTGL